MTKREFKELRESLEKQLQEVREFLGRIGQETRELELDIPQDSADRSVSSLSQETLFEQASQRREQMRRIEAALRRMDDGSFGTCQSCQEPIAQRRLNALPWTQYCLQCQQMIEQETIETTAAAS
jgi:RNA polymerase-binding transcription factor